jgi:hypothetical protein
VTQRKIIRALSLIALTSLLTRCEEITHVRISAGQEFVGARVYLDGQEQDRMVITSDTRNCEAEVTFSDYWSAHEITIIKPGYRRVRITKTWERWGHEEVVIPQRFIFRTAS